MDNSDVACEITYQPHFKPFSLSERVLIIGRVDYLATSIVYFYDLHCNFQ